MRFGTAGQGLISMVKEYMSRTFLGSVILASPSRGSRGISILSPGVKETVCVQK